MKDEEEDKQMEGTVATNAENCPAMEKREQHLPRYSNKLMYCACCIKTESSVVSSQRTKIYRTYWYCSYCELNFCLMPYYNCYYEFHVYCV